MAFDSTPGDLPGLDDRDDPALPFGPVRRRRLVLAVILALVLIVGLSASGALAEVRHAVAHAFPNLMIDGCGGG